MKQQSEIKQISTKMSASRETDKANKNDEEMNAGAGTMQAPTPNPGEEGKETNTRNRRGIQIHRIKELLQIHTAHEYFKGDTPEVGAVLGLMSK